MIDKMKPIQGYFSAERVRPDGTVIDRFEKKNMVMARVPEIIAGQMSGLYQKHVEDHLISAIALGTGGLQANALGKFDPKPVRNDRVSLYAERDFWWTEVDLQAGLPPVSELDKFVYQSTFEVTPFGDIGGNTASANELSIQNYGPTQPVWTATDANLPSSSHIGYPVNYRKTMPPTESSGQLTGTVSQRQNLVEYNFTLGQFAGNKPNQLVGYSEAALYMRLDNNTTPGDPQNGNPLGTMFSMVTFPPQWKDNTCAIRITWKIYF